MVWENELVNPRLGSGRAVSDILYIAESESEEETQ